MRVPIIVGPTPLGGRFLRLHNMPRQPVDTTILQARYLRSRAMEGNLRLRVLEEGASPSSSIDGTARD